MERQRCNTAAERRHLHQVGEPKDARNASLLFLPLRCVWCLQSLDSLRRERDLLKEELQRVMTENQEARGLILKAKEGRDVARKEEQRLRKERDKAIGESLRAALEKELLEKRLEHLEKQSQHPSRARWGQEGERVCCRYQ